MNVNIVARTSSNGQNESNFYSQHTLMASWSNRDRALVSTPFVSNNLITVTMCHRCAMRLEELKCPFSVRGSAINEHSLNDYNILNSLSLLRDRYN